MITEDDYGRLIYYVDGQQLNEFIASDAMTADGVAYLWEGESVYHIRFTPLQHAFGQQHKVSFAKTGALHSEDADMQVDILEDGRVMVRDTEVSVIPAREDLYSRSKGLIEVDILQNKRVLVIGLGSGGSNIAIELAKAGVGNFALVDFDRVEHHNLARHTCYVNELGRLKTDALYDAIKGKNPYANVDKFPININRNLDVLDEQVRKADVVLCCTDNNESRYNISHSLIRNCRIGLFGRAITRAEGGDVFIYRPGEACYCCLVGSGAFDMLNEEITDVASARRAGRIAAYVSEEDAEAMVQVGLSADIDPINNMMVKLTLMELSRGADSGISSLEEEFTMNYYMWANRRENKYAQWGRFDSAGLPTIMRWYGVYFEKSDDCSLCGVQKALDQGRDISDAYGDMARMQQSAFANINLDEL